jgi:hypothetical protein
MSGKGCTLKGLAMRSSEAATGTPRAMPACSISTTTGPTTTTPMSGSADPSLQHLDAGMPAEGSILVEGIPQATAKARQQAQPETAAGPAGAAAECGVDRIWMNGELVYDAKNLVNAQVDINRAVFLMNAARNRSHYPSLSDEELDEKRVLAYIKQAIKSLQAACYE